MSDEKREAYTERLLALAATFKPEEVHSHSVDDGSDFCALLRALFDLQESILGDSALSLLLDPQGLCTSLAVTWFQLGLLYAQEYGVPADISRLYATKPI